MVAHHSRDLVLPVKGLVGLAMCGGKSSRMGIDKSMLNYHGKPQRYHVYDMLAPVCGRVFISCNKEQEIYIDKNYPVLVDEQCYKEIGPMGGLLSAFDHFPKNDFLLVGCDYPFLKQDDLVDFLDFCKHENRAAAFYNEQNHFYEPLLAYYPQLSRDGLSEMFSSRQYSLQQFLQKNNAAKFFPSSSNSIKSADTKEEFEKAVELIQLTHVHEE